MSLRIVQYSYFNYIFNKKAINEFRRSCASAKHANKNTFVGKQINSISSSLASKGFLRSVKAYTPPDNVSDKIRNICSILKISNDNNYEINDLEQKYQFLTACFNDFEHAVPNSQIYEIQTIGDVIQFYETPVNTTLPLDALKSSKLPENLHIQHEYLRFNSETDTKFNGQTAFPKSSTLVTGLKYRKKYSGNIAKQSWP